MDFEKIVNKLLAKDPDDRYQNIIELPVDLKNIDLTGTGASRNLTDRIIEQGSNKPAFWQRVLPWSIAGLIAIVACVLWLKLHRQIPSPVNRCHINLPESAPLAPVGSAPFGIGRPSIIISPDGTKLVYVANKDGKNQLCLRPMDQLEAVPIPGTEGAFDPFFSPDGQWIGFFTESEMKKVSVGGGAPVSLCSAVSPFGASWGNDDEILFSNYQASMLSRISANGGIAEDITNESRYHFPALLPGGKAVLVSGIRAVFLDTREEKVLIEGGANPNYISTGHIIYSYQDKMMAVPFDPKKIKITGPAVPLDEHIRIEASRGAAQCTVSQDGTLVYLSGGSQNKTNLIWRGRSGNIEILPFPVEIYGTFRMSPDSRRLAIQIFKNGEWNIWIYNLISGSHRKFTEQGNNKYPVWTPNGKQMIFQSDRNGTFSLFMKSLGSSNKVQQIHTSTKSETPCSCSPDGEFLAYHFGADIYLLPLNGEEEPISFIQTPVKDWGPAFSPDGRWIAYVSQDQAEEIYVEPYPRTGERWKVSTDWGEEPVWSPNSNELFYRNGRKWMVVRFTTSPNFSPEEPKVLFEGDFVNVAGLSYDVSSDRQRFLLLRSIEESTVHTRLNVVFNWFEILKHKVPGGK